MNDSQRGARLLSSGTSTSTLMYKPTPMSRNSAPCSLSRALPRSSMSQLTSTVIFLTGLSPLKTVHSSTTCPYQRTFLSDHRSLFSSLSLSSTLWPPRTSSISTLRSSSLRWRPCATWYWMTPRRKNWLRSKMSQCSSSLTTMPHSIPGVSPRAALLRGSTTTSMQPKGNCDMLRELRITPNWLFTGTFLWSSTTPWRRFMEPPNMTDCASRYITARPLDSCIASLMSSWEERQSRSCPPTFLTWTYRTRSLISCMKKLQMFVKCSTRVLFPHLLNHLRVPGCVLLHLFQRTW